MATFFEKDTFLNRFLLFMTLVLFVWSALTDVINNDSWEATFSALRLLLQTQIIVLLNNFRRGLISVLLLRIIVAIVAFNGVVVAAQLLETVNILPTNFLWLIENFWQLGSDFTRKPGLFNGVLTSSLLSFMLLAFLLEKKSGGNIIIIIFAVGAIIFGSRTFLIFLPLLMLSYWRRFVGTVVVTTVVVTALLSTLELPSDMNHLLVTHFDERIVPTAQVATSLDSNMDYSSRDLVDNHYRMPNDIHEFLVGNGKPRYSPEGGQDPATMRWLLQVGFPGFLIVMMISGFICWRIARLGGVANLLFALSLVLVTAKGELVTSILIYPILLIYINAAPHFIRGANNHVR